jgi:anthranilate phosphoribosyltransferase
MTAPTIKHVIQKLASGEAFDAKEFESALDAMTSGDATPAQMGAFLMGLRVRGETVDEITGAARLMRSKMLTVAAPMDAIDIVGTGGDGHNTYNVSTCAAFVAAGAGVKVAKHGNRSVSSLSGASDVLAALGVKLDVPPAVVSRAITEAGVGFLWAPMHHPAMKVWAPIRADLGLRTIFNLLGPLTNPAGVKRQLVGVFAKTWVEPVAKVLRNLGSEHAWVVHGHDGMDELTTTGPTTVAELKDGKIDTFDVKPEDAGLARTTIAELKGGDAKLNASALRDVLSGKPSAYRDIVILNTAAALIVAGRATTLSEGAALAAAAIARGKAMQALESLVAATNQVN